MSLSSFPQTPSEITTAIIDSDSDTAPQIRGDRRSQYVFCPDLDGFFSLSMKATTDNVTHAALANAVSLFRRRVGADIPSGAGPTGYVLFGELGRDMYYSLERSTVVLSSSSQEETSVTLNVHISSPISAKVRVSKGDFVGAMLVPVMDDTTLGWRHRHASVKFSVPVGKHPEPHAVFTARQSRAHAEQGLCASAAELVELVWKEIKQETPMTDSDEQPMTLTPSQVVQLSEFGSQVTDAIESAWKVLFGDQQASSLTGSPHAYTPSDHTRDRAAPQGRVVTQRGTSTLPGMTTYDWGLGHVQSE